MRPTAKEFWDHRAAVYDADAGVFYREAYEKTTACMRKYLKPTDTVLDFACGTGIVTLSLSPDVKELRGIDISNEMIRRAQGKAAAQGQVHLADTFFVHGKTSCRWYRTQTVSAGKAPVHR